MKKWRRRSKDGALVGTLDPMEITASVFPIPEAVVRKGNAGPLCLDPLPRGSGHRGMDPIKLVRLDHHQTKPTGAWAAFWRTGVLPHG